MTKVLIRKVEKFQNLARSLSPGHCSSFTPFIRIIPSDRCNLDCKYCWQRKSQSYEMSLEEFSKYLQKAKQLKVGIISFLGGEPMLWGNIYDAISLCTKAHVLTDVTTNGTLLSENTIKKLGEAGLDYLNISVDGLYSNDITKKNYVIKNNLTANLKEAKKNYGMHSRLNAVIYKNNLQEVKQLIHFSRENNIQISFGFVVPPVIENMQQNEDIYFSLSDEKLITEIIDFILSRKKEGYPIIDPESYYLNIFKFLRKEKFWECNYPTKYGWINVAPDGKIRSCTKKMDELDYNFTELNTRTLTELRNKLGDNVRTCNIHCYSNCAYDSYFYTHHKIKLFEKILSRM